MKRTPRAARQAELLRLQALGRLAGGIAHDFNNLLAAIRLSAEAIGERAGLDAESRADAAQIQASAGRGAALVARLLSFVRQQPPAPGPVDVNVAVRETAAMLSRPLGEAIAVRLDLEEPARLAHLDRVQLDQVLVNLAVNARDAMPQGGTLALRTGHASLPAPLPGFPDSVPPGRYLTVAVEDSGSGIPPDVLPRIFTPLFTTRAGKPGALGGTGLGLATVHAAIRGAGGHLSVTTALGEGTRMLIHLPLWEGPLPALAPLPPLPAALPVAGRCVLLVEDEAPVRLLAERALARRGWRVLSADCGEAALGLLDPASPPDVVVSDMGLPGMDGVALVHAVRARLGRPGLPAILVSGYAAEPLRVAIEAAGASYLAKPYRMAELADRLAAI